MEAMDLDVRARVYDGPMNARPIPVPTPFVVRSKGGSWYGHCIWDSMGIAAMLHADVTLESSCGCCGAQIALQIPADCRSDDERVAHFAIPAAHWWDDIVFN